ncbi:hypothetical protein P9112_013932 [Eukaryota sp. TZLM1-RC]
MTTISQQVPAMTFSTLPYSHVSDHFNSIGNDSSPESYYGSNPSCPSFRSCHSIGMPAPMYMMYNHQLIPVRIMVPSSGMLQTKLPQCGNPASTVSRFIKKQSSKGLTKTRGRPRKTVPEEHLKLLVDQGKTQDDILMTLRSQGISISSSTLKRRLAKAGLSTKPECANKRKKIQQQAHLVPSVPFTWPYIPPAETPLQYPDEFSGP